MTGPAPAPGTDPLPELWRGVAHVARARVAVLEDALHSLRRCAPDASARCAAGFEEAHKLVGSLDSFGRTGGSALALQAAVLLEHPAPDADALDAVLGALRRTVDGPDGG